LLARAMPADEPSVRLLSRHFQHILRTWSIPPWARGRIFVSTRMRPGCCLCLEPGNRLERLLGSPLYLSSLLLLCYNGYDTGTITIVILT
jgi:hypothetical protein